MDIPLNLAEINMPEGGKNESFLCFVLTWRVIGTYNKKTGRLEYINYSVATFKVLSPSDNILEIKNEVKVSKKSFKNNKCQFFY